MSITRINTNTDAMLASSNLRKMEFQMSRTLSHLSTGLRIVTGADDPAGIGLVATFRAQVGGIRTAVQNAQDGLSLLNTADSALADNMNMLLRMRDIAVRASSDATLTTTQRQTMEQEYVNLKGEIARRRSAITFNGKVLFSGAVSGKTIQIGPDNASGYKYSLKVPLISVTFFGNAARTLSNAHVSQVASAAKAIDIVQSCINGLANIQNIVGAQENELERIINDLNSEDVNMSAALSNIQDADMASEISAFARQQIIAQAATAMIAQANAQPSQVMKLLGIG
jgi:flagellin